MVMEKLLLNIATLTGYGLFIYSRTMIDYILIEKYKVDLKGIYKTFTSIITVIMCFMVSVIISPFLFPPLLLIYGVIFDSILNLLRGRAYDYLGSGPVDSFYKKIPYQFFIRIIIILVLLIIPKCLNIP